MSEKVNIEKISYEFEIERLRAEKIQLTERLRAALQKIDRHEGCVMALRDVLDRLIDKLADR